MMVGPQQQRNDAVISTQEVGGSSSSENHGASPSYPKDERRKMFGAAMFGGSVCIAYRTGRQCKNGAKCPFRHEMPKNPISHHPLYLDDDPVRFVELFEAGNMGPLKPPPEDQSVKTICIRRLNSSVLEQDIRDHFWPYGEIESIRFFDQTGVTCAFLTYTTHQAAEKAVLELSSWVDINGQMLNLLDQDTRNRILARSTLLPLQQRMDPQRNDAAISTQEVGGSSSSENHGASSSYQMPPHPQDERRKRFGAAMFGGSRHYHPVCIAYRTGRQCRNGAKCPFRHDMPKNPISHHPFDLNT